MKYPVKDVAQVSQTDWARLAAYIDGEGYIGIARIRAAYKRGKSPNSCQHIVEMRISNTDFRLTAWLQGVFGGNVKLQRKPNPKWRDICHWAVTGRNAVKLLRGCYKFLLLKREQAEIAFALQELVQGKERRGHRESISPLEWKEREQLCDKISVVKSRGVKEVVNG